MALTCRTGCALPELRCTRAPPPVLTCHGGGAVTQRYHRAGLPHRLHHAHAKGGVASTCWTCHTPGQDMSTVQSAAGCGHCGRRRGLPRRRSPRRLDADHLRELPRRHGAATDPARARTTSCRSPTSRSRRCSRSAPASVKVKKTVKVTGLAESATGGRQVAVQVDRKSRHQVGQGDDRDGHRDATRRLHVDVLQAHQEGLVSACTASQVAASTATYSRQDRRTRRSR